MSRASRLRLSPDCAVADRQLNYRPVAGATDVPGGRHLRWLGRDGSASARSPQQIRKRCGTPKDMSWAASPKPRQRETSIWLRPSDNRIEPFRQRCYLRLKLSNPVDHTGQ